MKDKKIMKKIGIAVAIITGVVAVYTLFQKLFGED